MNEDKRDQLDSREEAALPPRAEERAPVRTTARPHPALLSDSMLQAQCQLNQLRRSGPGGQHRNKVSTAIQWTHRPSGILAEANESRDQQRNRRTALRRLRLRLAIRLRSEPLLAESPSDKSPSGEAVLVESALGQRSVDGLDGVGAGDLYESFRQLGRSRRLKVSPDHHDFPSFLAIVMDDLHLAGGQPSLVATAWDCSTTAIVNLLAAQPAALEEVNRWRTHHHRGRLRGR